MRVNLGKTPAKEAEKGRVLHQFYIFQIETGKKQAIFLSFFKNENQC
jgi:hypothetical protein